MFSRASSCLPRQNKLCGVVFSPPKMGMKKNRPELGNTNIIPFLHRAVNKNLGQASALFYTLLYVTVILHFGRWPLGQCYTVVAGVVGVNAYGHVAVLCQQRPHCRALAGPQLKHQPAARLQGF